MNRRQDTYPLLSSDSVPLIPWNESYIYFTYVQLDFVQSSVLFKELSVMHPLTWTQIQLLTFLELKGKL